MGKSYFTLELDTTPPTVEIIAPHYTTLNVSNNIIVFANEKLDLWQEVYAIDAAGDRHDFIFAHDGNQFVGLIDFSTAAIGITTVYARVRDTVHNVSALVSATINVVVGAKVFVFAEAAVRKVAVTSTSYEITTDTITREIDTEVG